MLVTESDVLRCLADEKCRDILANIHESKALSITALKITRKQYYSRLHSTITCTLVHKRNGQYQLTLFGKVVYNWYLRLREITSNEYWKLAAIDILNLSSVPDSHRIKITNSLIQNDEVKQSLLSSVQE